jgi:hypothetical protein
VLLTGTFFVPPVSPHEKEASESEVPLMTPIPPWHSIRQRDGNVYHDDDECPVAKEIDQKYRRAGHRCRRRCRECAKLRDPALQSSRLARLMPL